jgi:hypothetical protein
MPDPNAKPSELPNTFDAVKITSKDGRTQFGYWNGAQWKSQLKRVEVETILKWEPLPNGITRS